MSNRFSELMFTPHVRAIQEEMGSRASYARFTASGTTSHDRLGKYETSFIAARESFYLATVSETGWPYVQHRGGPPGFVRILDDRTIGFADYRGNKQYISAGNLATDDRVALFMMDYHNRQRLKLLGHARAVDSADEPDVCARLRDPSYAAVIERGIVIVIEGFDWNCPQHITPRFSEAEIERMLAPFRDRMEALEKENAELKAALKSKGR